MTEFEIFIWGFGIIGTMQIAQFWALYRLNREVGEIKTFIKETGGKNHAQKKIIQSTYA